MSRSSGRNVFDDEAEPQEQLSPAERYARSRQRSAHPRLADFTAAQPFRLDPFQVTACEAVEDGHGVLVCAPTGAGKTLVGEFAVFQALTTGGKCFYTTPIKALSNQKYADLVAIYGTERVGLLTGDTSINPHADAVVMTTEVLRNMLYAGSADLAGLTAVVLDEIHYLADKFRGAVWEEVILHLADQVQVIGLSATVSNAEEFGAWLQTVRGDTTIVVDEVRPVPLWQHMMVGRRLYDLFTADPEQLEGGRVRIDPTLARAVSAAEGTADRYSSWDRGRGKGWHQPRWRPTPRVDMVERLDGAGLLPAIFFIFSRAGCDAAVGQCVRSGLRLTTDGERAQIREIIDRHTASLPEGDLAVLGYWEWREALERGLAAHHAGLLPAFKETVEELFVEGLVKAVFATETLALGINMPARTVVLEKLVKFNGEGHVDLTPGEYTQLTGRAGRRGIDVEGHAVVVWSPGMDPRTVAGLAAKRTYPLRSSFRPSYNMAVNLVGRMGRSAARDLLEQSFAQYQADSSVVGLVRQQHRNAEAIAGHAKAMTCHLGDVVEYLRLLTDLGDAEKRQAREGAARRRSQTSDDLAALRRGDVIHVPTGRRSGMAVVLDSGVEPDGTARPLVVTDKRWAGRLSTADFRGAVPVLGKVRVDRFTDHRAPGVRRDIASALAAAIKAGTVARPGKNRRVQVDEDRAIADLRRQVRAHPVHGCADRAEHLQWARRWQRLTIENAALAAKVNGAKGSLGEALDRILALLVRHRFVEAGTDELTSAGRMLARLWSESDLVVAECLRSGAWDRLGPPELAAVVSTLVFESRRDNPAGQRVGAKNAAEAIKATQQIWARISADEVDAGLPTTRQPEVGFTGAVAVWARGGSLATALDAAADCGAELSAGDFVRWCRQVIDLLDQIRLIDTSPCAPTAAAAVSALRRGVVALGAE